MNVFIKELKNKILTAFRSYLMSNGYRAIMMKESSLNDKDEIIGSAYNNTSTILFKLKHFDENETENENDLILSVSSYMNNKCDGKCDIVISKYFKINTRVYIKHGDAVQNNSVINNITEFLDGIDELKYNIFTLYYDDVVVDEMTTSTAVFDLLDYSNTSVPFVSNPLPNMIRFIFTNVFNKLSCNYNKLRSMSVERDKNDISFTLKNDPNTYHINIYMNSKTPSFCIGINDHTLYAVFPLTSHVVNSSSLSYLIPESKCFIDNYIKNSIPDIDKLLSNMINKYNDNIKINDIIKIIGIYKSINYAEFEIKISNETFLISLRVIKNNDKELIFGFYLSSYINNITYCIATISSNGIESLIDRTVKPGIIINDVTMTKELIKSLKDFCFEIYDDYLKIKQDNDINNNTNKKLDEILDSAISIKDIAGSFITLNEVTHVISTQNKTDTDKNDTKLDIKRIGKTDYYLNIAHDVALRSTCLRRKFGAVIVKDDRIVSTGYNGAPRNRANCCDRKVCYRQEHNIPSGQRYELCRSVHAEMNAIINSDIDARKDSTLFLVGIDAGTNEFIDADCCSMCKRVIINSGISNVIFKQSDGSLKMIPVSDWIKNDDSLDIDHKGY